MDSDATRRKRLDDIESKRKRLEEMRKSRSSVISSQSSSISIISTSDNSTNIADTESGTKIDTDALVSSLLASAPALVIVPQDSTLALDNVSPTDPSIITTVSIQDIRTEKLKSLTTVKCENVCSIFPATRIMYDKSIQTDFEEQERQLDATLDKEDFTTSSVDQGSSNTSNKCEIEPKAELSIKRTLSEVDCKKIMSSSDFISFFHTASLYTERALTFSGQHMDILKDFSALNNNMSSDYIAGDASFQSTDVRYQEDCITTGRPVMHMQWSPLVPDLFLAAYGSKDNIANALSSSALHNTVAADEEVLPGLVCVWSRDFPTRAEFKFIAPSPVLTAIFHTQETYFVLGGCYNGQILLWDMRAQTEKPNRFRGLPVQRSSATGKGHKHPVYAMTMINNSTNSAVGLTLLISVSNDGLLCQWDITRLMEPLTVIQLQSFVNFSLLSISAMTVVNSGGSGEAPTDILFGSSSGSIIYSSLPFKEVKPDIRKVDCHCGLITSIHPNPNRSSKYKHLLLTSSLDWTVKLWDLKNFTKPLIEFPSLSYDYVCDVQWSPINPAVFITITSGCKVSLWNLSKSIAEPVESLIISSNIASSVVSSGSADVAKVKKIALNRTLWARDGQSVLIGDSLGALHLLKLLPSTSSSSQISSSDETRFELAMLNRNDYEIGLETKYDGPADTTDMINVDENHSSLKDDFESISLATNV